MTAHAMKGDRERCLEAGMDDYVAKPIQQDKLRQAIEDCVLPIRETAAAEPPAGASASPMDVVAAWRGWMVIGTFWARWRCCSWRNLLTCWRRSGKPSPRIIQRG